MSKKKTDALPADQAQRLALVGVVLYGKSFRARLAEGLNITRSTLWLWLQGEIKNDRDIDGELIELLDCERDAATERGLRIADLRRRFMKKKEAA